jgi:uncharacterized protein YecT (DUF1311 family)
LFPAVAATTAPVQNGGSGSWNWANAHDPGYDDGPEYAESKAICRQVSKLVPPKTDWPDAAQARELAKCDSEALYYGIGMQADPVKARQCALLEARRGQVGDGGFHGDALLMTVYANGHGAARNLELATAMACRVEGAPAEVDGRVKHLNQLLKTGWQGDDFSFCDDITSGLAEGQCAAHRASMADVTREHRFDAMAQSWTPAQKKAFSMLRGAADAYVRASSGNEVDMTGTARGARSIAAGQRLNDEFADVLAALQAGKPLTAGDVSFRQADEQLNEIYGRVMLIQTPDSDRLPSDPPDVLPDTSVSKSGIRETQRTWLRYRDAWVAFAAARFPKVDADMLKTRLTLQRTDDLQQFLR